MRIGHHLALLACLIAVCLLTAGCSSGSAPVDPSGPWRAWLDSPGGEIPFGLAVERDGERTSVSLINGVERIPVARAELDGTSLVLHLDPYDSVVRAELAADGSRLDGEWRRTAPEKETRLSFHAVRGEAPRFPAESAGARALIDGRWSVTFASDDEPAVGIFEQRDDGTVEGTFLTTTGDYRYLAGTVDGNRLRLSCFDGAHAFLFDARLTDDASLSGDFWSRDTWHDTWTATRAETAELPDAFELTRWVGEQDLGSIRYPDLDGNPRALDDPAFAGHARIIEVFGSWCPNCNDATAHFVELDRRYRDRGLSILGLAFEMTGELERDTRIVRDYAAHHGAEFPILVAGVSDKSLATRAFPLIDRVRSYPTTIFLHGDGRVRAVYQGYSGPATGAAHTELRARYEAIIEELLAEGS